MSEPGPSLRRMLLAIVSLLVVAALPFVLFLALRGNEADVCPVLAAERVLQSEGTDFVFTLPEAGRYEVGVQLSAHCTSKATVHIARLRTALRPDPVYEPDPAVHTLEVRAGHVPQVLEFAWAGPCLLRIEPIPMAMGMEATPTSARVTVRPAGR